MDKSRKPIPKTQYDISTELVTPYDATNGNPNDAITPLPRFKNANDLATVNAYRALETAANTSDLPFALGLEDVDEAVFYYFNNVIQPSVMQNAEKIAVPVVYGNPERWYSVQKQGYFRDKNGALMCPLIMVKRNSLEPNKSLTSKIDANTPYNYATLAQTFNKKNVYSNFDVLNNRKAVQTFQAVVVPDYVKITYSCIIWTYYTEQMNKIVEAINYAGDSYWGNPNKYKFKASIASFTNNETVAQGENRIIKTGFDIQLNGHIVPDTLLKQVTAQKQFSTKAKITITSETTGSL